MIDIREFPDQDILPIKILNSVLVVGERWSIPLDASVPSVNSPFLYRYTRAGLAYNQGLATKVVYQLIEPCWVRFLLTSTEFRRARSICYPSSFFSYSFLNQTNPSLLHRHSIPIWDSNTDLLFICTSRYQEVLTYLWPVRHEWSTHQGMWWPIRILRRVDHPYT